MAAAAARGWEDYTAPHMNKYAMFAPGTDRTISKEEWRRQQATLIKAIDPEFSGSLVCPVTVRNWRKLEASAATSTADNGAADLSDFNGMAAAADPSAAAAALGNSLPRTEKPATSPNAEGASAGYYAPSAASSTPTSSVSTFTDSSASGASSVSLSPSPPPPGALNVLPSPSAATAPAATPAAAPAAAPAAPGSTNTSAASSPANSGKLPRVRMSLAQQIREQQMNSGRFKPLVSGRFRDGASDSGRFPMSPLEPNSGPNSGKFSAVSPSSSQGNSGAFPSPAGHYATRSMGADGGGGASGPLAMAQPSALWRQSSDGHRMAGATMEQSRMAGATMQHGQQAPPMGFCMGAQGMGAQGMGAQGMGAQGMGAQMMGAPGATVGVVPAMSPPAMGGPSQSNNLSPRDLILLRPNKWSGANVADAPLLPTFGSCALSDTASQCSSQDSFSSTPQLSRPVPSFASHPPNTGSWDGSNAEEDNEEKELDFSSVRSVCLNFEEVLETSETKEFNRVRIETIDIVPLISGMKSPFMAAAAANLPEHVLYALTFSGSDDIYLPGDESVLKLFPSRFQARYWEQERRRQEEKAKKETKMWQSWQSQGNSNKQEQQVWQPPPSPHQQQQQQPPQQQQWQPQQPTQQQQWQHQQQQPPQQQQQWQQQGQQQQQQWQQQQPQQPQQQQQQQQWQQQQQQQLSQQNWQQQQPPFQQQQLQQQGQPQQPRW